MFFVEDLKKIHGSLENALLKAAVEKNIELLIFIIGQAGVDLNAKDANGDTAMHIVARNRNNILIEHLYNKGALINPINYNGNSPIDELILNAEKLPHLSSGSTQHYRVDETIRILINYDAHVSLDLNIPYDGSVKALIRSKVAIQCRARNNSYEQYYKTGARFFKSRLHGVDLIADEREPKEAEAQVTPSGNLFYRNHYLKGYQDAAHYKYDLDTLKTKHGSLERALVIEAGEGDVNAVKYLLDNDVNVNARIENGFSALHYAVRTDNVLLMQLLINRGADVNAEDGHGHTPLRKALDYQTLLKTSYTAIEMPRICCLFKNGADLYHVTNRKNVEDYMSPYQYADSLDPMLAQVMVKMFLESTLEKGRNFARQQHKNPFPYRNICPLISSRTDVQAAFREGYILERNLLNHTVRDRSSTLAVKTDQAIQPAREGIVLEPWPKSLHFMENAPILSSAPKTHKTETSLSDGSHKRLVEAELTSVTNNNAGSQNDDGPANTKRLK